MTAGLFFRQLFESESSTYTYLLADRASKEAILIDPVYETAERDWRLINELGFSLKYIFETHVHADHVTGAAQLKKRCAAKTVVGEGSKIACADILVKDEQVFTFGAFKIRAMATPGHTDSCTSYVVEDMVFTGDALLIRGTGRTDFQQGSSPRLYQSIMKKLFTLPDSTLVYPAHDYTGTTASSIGEEKKLNPRVGNGKSEADFVSIMSALELTPPKKIHIALPANLKCGEL